MNRAWYEPRTLVALGSMVPLALLAGCSTVQQARRYSQVDEAVAVIQPTQGNTCRGTVRFRESGDRVVVTADLEGLTPNAKHAIHIHQYGDCTASDATSAGAHYNPEDHPHGLPPGTRHAGDLGNLQSDANGRAHYEITVDNISIAAGRNAVLGLAVIVHAKLDDGSQPTGNAGGRLGCGVIGTAKP